jgi:hypothetical protein
MQEYLGWPVVTAENCFHIILSQCGIVPWPKAQNPMPLEDYLAQATQAQRDEYQRFGPKNEVVFYRNPSSLDPFTGFQSIFKPYAIVFGLINEMVPVTAEWKHGNGLITIVPVCGVPGKAESHLPTIANQMMATGRREWQEETGTKLESITSLSPTEGLWSEVRKGYMRCFPFLGKVKEPIKKGPTKLDQNETLSMVLFPIQEWVKLIESPHLWDQHPEFGLESCCQAVTYLALRQMNRLQLT